ncbi:succinate dehydrogenase, cytochrome b556 subunit [Sulfuritalea hydrogenivorans]|jgi:succinate dehydrogenase / fumarate reductase cytochrome b subunit|uniref:Succinate dehydrogenase cytochrome b556 subunit n=1 Tax=Sulfuritalea hydrogenivorans sk43H TaxID=1223802 RepID=W0SF50_9PROT|nr:succinate dehydrogenase, cytochrome b556 subunit [Sulfuritalea hydrogenivorans]MDK9714620.1 succinate dehydrogenase, cytochrome b556 subunit [Sulfuritalea sp.]BAO29592.1 succinate dehydrogenase [Sulfuritalea hydrogenivorans sk43H]
MPEITKQRPKYLALHEIRLPLAGFASILHRVSGAGLFLMLPLLIWILQLSLGSTQESADLFKAVTGNLLVKLVLLGLLWAFLHHFCMGIRILLIDIHVGVEKQQAHNSAVAVMVVSLALTLIFGLKLLGAY